ncbi:MAG TPA: hypothetical protein VFF30_11410 [Nitrososphaerales archaeon]|nr:hypothetical protein [Nitrososphaerales archaeon]
MAASKYKKGDLVIVDDDGRATEFEIVSSLLSNKESRVAGGEESCYEAKDLTTGKRRTISEDQILRLATPVDNSSELFAQQNRGRSGSGTSGNFSTSNR